MGRQNRVERRAQRLIRSKPGTVDYDHFLAMHNVAWRYGFTPTEPNSLPRWEQRKRPVALLATAQDHRSACDLGYAALALLGSAMVSHISRVRASWWIHSDGVPACHAAILP